VVVPYGARAELHSWPHRGGQGAHHPSSMGIRRIVVGGNLHCTLGKPRIMPMVGNIGQVANTTQSTLLYSRYGNGIATNNLSKMLAGLMLPGRPVGNMYFAAWSHNVISNVVNLSNDLKMGEYRKWLCLQSRPCTVAD
jgi:hypothetical protein